MTAWEWIRSGSGYGRASAWGSIGSPWMKQWTWGLGATLVGVWVLAVVVRLALFNAIDLSDLPGAAGADSVVRALRGEISTWDVWFIHLLLPMVDGDMVAASHAVAGLSGVWMMLGVSLAGWACVGPAGMLAGAIVGATWSVAILPTLLVGPDPPTVGLAWLGLGLTWSGARLKRLGWGATVLGVFLVVWAIATKPVALPALGLLPIASIWLKLDQRERFIQWGLIGVGLLFAWWVLNPDLAQHEGGLQPMGWSSLYMGIDALFGMRTNWPDGALHWVFMSALVWGVLPGKGWLRRAGWALSCAGVLALTAAGLGSRLCPRLLLVGAFGCLVSMAMLMLFIGERLPAIRGIRWAPLGLLGGLLFLDSWAWVEAWDQERNRFAGSDLADLPSAPDVFAARYRVYGDSVHSSRLLDLTSAGASSLMSLPTGTQGVAIAPLRDRREQHLAVAAALANVPMMVLEEHHCCEYPTTLACAERVVNSLQDSGAVFILPSALGSADMVDEDNTWLFWLRQAASTQSGWNEGDSHWSLLRSEGMGGPLPCKPQYPTQIQPRWPPPWPTDGTRGFALSEGGEDGLDRQGADDGAEPPGPGSDGGEDPP